MNLIIWLVMGGVIGWLASIVMHTNSQQGIGLNVVVGVVGAMIGGWLIGPMVGVATINSNDFSLPALMVSFWWGGYSARHRQSVSAWTRDLRPRRLQVILPSPGRCRTCGEAGERDCRAGTQTRRKGREFTVQGRRFSDQRQTKRDRKSTRLNSSHGKLSRMPSSA